MAPGAPDPRHIARDVEAALAEDIGTGDLTAGLLTPGTRLATRVIVRESAVMAGRPWFDETYRQLGGAVEIQWQVDDGQDLATGQEICRLRGDAATVLSGERTALNFIQTLSGTATLTRRYVAAVAGTGARILDTRKTLPGLRAAQKYAVLCGGGNNHRMGLYDAILIKENHISVAGSVTAAVEAAQREHPDVLIEVEVEDMEQLAEAAACGTRRALLDHFGVDLLRQAVSRYGEQIELEASGDVNLENVGMLAATGVDYISTGAITKHVRAVDFSMRFV